MSNLLHETIGALKENGKTEKDIKWIGSNEVEIPQEMFFKMADTVYDAGYGGHEVASDLMIVGDDWWLERAEYDGSEWWEFKTMPNKPKNKFVEGDVCLTTTQAINMNTDKHNYLFMGDSLMELNKERKDGAE